MAGQSGRIWIRTGYEFPAGAIERHQAAIAEANAEIAQLAERIAAIDAPARRSILAARGTSTDSAKDSPVPSLRWDFTRELDDSAGGLSSEVHGGGVLGGGVRSAQGLAVDGEGAFVASAPLPRGLRAKTIEAWVVLDDLEQRGGGVVSVQTLDGRVFDAIVFGEREPGRWMAGSDNFRRTRAFGGPLETEAHDRPAHVAITYAEDGTSWTAKH